MSDDILTEEQFDILKDIIETPIEVDVDYTPAIISMLINNQYGGKI